MLAVQLRYGNYYHADGEVSVSIAKSVETTDAGIPFRTTHTWNIAGRIIGETIAEVVQRMGLLERAYGTWFRTAQLISSAGIVCHELPNAGSITGVKVIQPPSYPDGSGAQLSTYRDYVITLSADYPAIGYGVPLIKSWVETITFTGGRPVRGLVETVNGPSVPFVIKRQRPYRATQVGSAVGAFGYPPYGAMLWDESLLEGEDPESKSLGAPRTENGRLVDWPVSWSYRFGSVAPLNGLPNVLPTG